VTRFAQKKLAIVDLERRYEQLSWKFERQNLELVHDKNIRDLETQLTLVLQEMRHHAMMERNRGTFDHLWNALQATVNNIKGAFLSTRLLN